MGLMDELRSRNFSLYGQWGGIVSIILLIVLGAISVAGNIPFAIIGWIFAFILFFVEVPLCMKVCPTSPKFDTFVSHFENAYLRAALYLGMGVIMLLSNTVSTTILNLPAVILVMAGVCYLIAAVKQQPHASSKILGGTGVDNVV
ncbi:putative clathrin-coated vesicle protein [Hesseltinella vesiculosa]|uniref:Putative clathrin-coated vesicle protein n=1 Tax=Hesseltinella vesiculosa TaxID=101127 RepID=A0A1X2GP19_9FUNG|nr:putative clathrin-coated vesicle protein [Hesseltinella vesiculosa]